MERARQILERAEARRLALPGRGVEIALLDWGGDGPLALLHHANGFCKGVWGEVATSLSDRFRVVAMDARGHGDSSRPELPEAYRWDEFALDLIAVAEELVGDGRVELGVGHSFGGTTMLGAAARRPDLFGRILLVDPVTPPPQSVPRTPERLAHIEKLAGGARKRRSEWPSREEARRWWQGRELFSAWRPEALDLYALDGLAERAGGGVALKCAGEVEARVFENGEHTDVFALARQVETPCLFLWAEQGNFPRPVYEQLVASMAAGRVESVPAGHLVPMERPDLVVSTALRFAGEDV